jgi:hypothetical protein
MTFTPTQTVVLICSTNVWHKCKGHVINFIIKLLSQTSKCFFFWQPAPQNLSTGPSFRLLP